MFQRSDCRSAGCLARRWWPMANRCSWPCSHSCITAQEFRRFPLVTLEPLPDLLDMGDTYRFYHFSLHLLLLLPPCPTSTPTCIMIGTPRRAAKGELGVRVKDMDKPLICGKTAKSYKVCKTSSNFFKLPSFSSGTT